jgi:hypothetical protein
MNGRIAQLAEQQPFKLMVGGSNPSAPTLSLFFDNQNFKC